MSRRIVAVICGGDSGEHDVSLRSAKGIYGYFDRSRYEPHILELCGRDWSVILPDGSKNAVDKNDFSFVVEGKRVHPDFAFIIIHGRPGENGMLQGYLDMMGVPYSTSGVLTESLTFNKFYLNQFLRAWGVSVAESVLLRRNSIDQVTDKDIISKLGLPCFVKPDADGSSLGVSKVKSEDELRPAIMKAFKSGNEVIVETFLDGTEVTCGCYKTRKVARTLPVTEVVPAVEFFNYDAKYNGAVKEITPARITADLTRRIQTLTSAIYDILGCEGIIRVDYILTGAKGKPKEKINLLEVNTVPGMTETSFIPQQLRAAGLQLGDVLTEIIENKFA